MESNIWYPYDGSPSSPVRRAKRGNAGASGASRNAAGELGKPPCGSRIPVPRCVETPRRCKGIACGLPPAELPGYAIVWVPYVGFHPLVASTAGDLPHDRPWAYEGKTRACRLLTRPVSVNGRKGRELKSPTRNSMFITVPCEPPCEEPPVDESVLFQRQLMGETMTATTATASGRAAQR